MKKQVVLIFTTFIFFLLLVVLLVFNLDKIKNPINFRSLGLGNRIKKDDSAVFNKENKGKNKDVIIYYGNDDEALEKKPIVITKEEETIEQTVFNKIKENTDILKDVEVISVETENAVCNLNLSKEFLYALQGSVGEHITIYSIVNSLTELKHVDKVQFFIEGKKGFETGHNTYYGELKKNEEFID